MTVSARGIGPEPAAAVRAAPLAFGTGSLRLAWRAVLAVASIAIAIGFASVTKFQDAITYYAAGQRLNDGHPLYALSAGDIAVALNPPYWSVPLLSPPFMAVVWRPLEAIGPVGLFAWFAVLFVAMLVAAAILFSRAPLAVAICAPALGYLWGSGNVHGFVFVGAAAAWTWRDRWWIGIPLGVLTAAKLFPIILLAFLVAGRNRRGVVAFAVTAAVCTAIGVIGAGLDATLQYPAILLSSAPQPEMLASVTGLRWLTPILVVGAMAVAVLLRDRWSYRAAILGVVVAFGLSFAQSSVIALLALPRRDSDESPGTP